MFPDNQTVVLALNETNQLIAIFLKSIETAKKNRDIEKQRQQK